MTTQKHLIPTRPEPNGALKRTIIVYGIVIIPGGVVATLLIDIPADDVPDAVFGGQLEGEVATDAVSGAGDEDGLPVEGLRGKGEELPVDRLKRIRHILAYLVSKCHSHIAYLQRPKKRGAPISHKRSIPSPFGR